MRVVSIVSMLIFAGACSKGAVSSKEPVPPPQEPVEESDVAEIDDSPEMSEESSAMHERFLAVNGIRDAVIEGDLADVQQRAKALAANEKLLSVFAEWGPHTKIMKTEIEQVAVSPDLSTASVHTAAAAHACGRCHQNLGVATLEDEKGTVPEDAADIGGIMRQHHWAIGRMWDGLVAPSDASWMTGATTLAEIANQAQGLPEATSNAELPPLLKEVETLAKEAAESITGPEKTQVFGQLLTSCSGCHQLMWKE